MVVVYVGETPYYYYYYYRPVQFTTLTPLTVDMSLPIVSPDRQISSESELVTSLAELAIAVGRDTGNDPVSAADVESAIERWCDTYVDQFERLLEVALVPSRASTTQSHARARTLAQHELEAALQAASEGDGARASSGPNRVSTALCCHALNRIARHRNLKHFHHLDSLRRELFHSIYRPSSSSSSSSFSSSSPPSSSSSSPQLSSPSLLAPHPSSSTPDLADLPALLRATPYFEVVRKLKRQVDKLLNERHQYTQMQSRAKDRRHMRKQVLMRTSRNWQQMLVNSAFRQWRETSKNTVRQREMLARYFRRIKAVTLPDIFRAWKVVAVGEKLTRTQNAKSAKEGELKMLEERLHTAKKAEGDLMMEMVRMEKDTKALRLRLKSVQDSIAAQRVPETRAVISAVGDNLNALGDISFKNLESIVSEASAAPDPQVLAGIFFVEDDEARESKLKRQRKKPGAHENDRIFSESQVQYAFAELVKLSPDRLLLRWVKYRLRLGRKHTVGGRRVENFGEDLRDGILYGSLLNRLSRRQNRSRVANEIDPQRRIDVVLAQAARLDPPASGFITTGHILGGDTALNLAFIGRLFNTHGRLAKTSDSPDVKAISDRMMELKSRWLSAKELLAQLTEKGKWQMYRATHDDDALKRALADFEQVAHEIALLGADAEPLMAESLQSSQIGWALRHKVSDAVWQIFTFKILREEESKLPFPIIDLRRERMLNQYTKLGSDAEIKTILKASLSKSERQGLAEALPGYRAELEGILVEHFEDLSKIFQHYAAGDDSGGATEMSRSEFWEIVKDCDLTKGSADSNSLKKETVNRIYQRAVQLEALDTGHTGSIADVEISPDGFVNALIEVSLRKYRKAPSWAKRMELLLTKNILPKACRTNTDTFRKDLSQDDVQAVFKKYAPRLRAVFEYYARQTQRRAAKKGDDDDAEASAEQELDMDMAAWTKLCKDFKVGALSSVLFLLSFC